MVFCIKIEVLINSRNEEYRFLRDKNNKVRKFSSLAEVRKYLESWRLSKSPYAFYQPTEVYQIGKSLRDLVLVATYMTPFLGNKPEWKEVETK